MAWFRAPSAPPTPAPTPAAIPDHPLPPRPQGRAVTWRSVLLCLFLIPVSSFWQISMESVRNSTHPTSLSLPFHVVFILLLLAGLNRVWARVFGEARALAPGELLLVYSVLAIASAICGVDMLQVLIPTVTYSFRYGAAEGWDTAINPYLPKWLTISDPHLFERYYIGNGSVWEPAIFMAWLPVVIRWTGFIALLLWVMLCLNAVLRRAWTDAERLTFPVVQLPLQIAQTETWTARGLFGNRLFWIGFLLAGSLDMVNSLQYFFPAVPAIGVPGDGFSYFDLQSFPNGVISGVFNTAPLSAVGWTPVSWYPFVVGLGVLMPLDFLLSIPVFYWYWKLQRVVFVALAITPVPRFPYIENQAFGAYLSFCVLSIYVMRPYLAQVWRKACGDEAALDDSREPMRYRVAVWGGLAGVAGLVAFATVLGLPWWVAVLFFLIYFALALAITRMRAELGTPVHDLHSTGPEMLLTRVAGSHAFDTHGLVALGMLEWFNRAYRSHPMPHQLEGYKLADIGGSDRRKWTGAMMGLGVFAAFTGFYIFLHLMYRYGAAAQVRFAYGRETWETLAGWLNNPLHGDPGEAWAIVIGFALAAGMQAARLYFPWFPLHPLAFAITSSWQMNLVWAPLTIAYICKASLLRFGGLRGFRNALPFFFGLMLGQFVVGGFWNVWGTLAGLPTYRFWD